MENLTLALRIAFSVLISVILVALILFIRNKMAVPIEEKNIEILQQQKLDFNKEYEAYNKGLLRGTEILSILNKANNNNISLGVGYVTKSSVEMDKNKVSDIVNISLTLKKKLEYSLEIKYLDEFGNIESHNGEATFGTNAIHEILGIRDFEMKLMPTRSGISGNNILIKNVLKQKRTTELNVHNLYDDITENKKYDLVKNNIRNTEIVKFLEISGTPKKELVNSNVTKNKNNNWYSITYKTPGNDLIRRKFKCTEVKYSNTTGLIKQISFEEI